ncbi:MAG: glycerophosphodiester phosphodiesterase [Gemmatimonadaceae bacterium]
MPRLAPENTLPSFSLALEAGADGLELDVHATRDGVVVIHHDPALRDGTVIADTTFAELRPHEVAPGVAVPTLAELCELVAGRAELCVEVKGAGIEQLVLDALSDYEGPLAIHSFDHALIRRIRALDPNVRLGILFDDAPTEVARQMEATGATDVWPQWTLVEPALVAAVHAAGGRVIPWTVNDTRHARALAAIGVDALCGDDVNLLVTD